MRGGGGAVDSNSVRNPNAPHNYGKAVISLIYYYGKAVKSRINFEKAENTLKRKYNESMENLKELRKQRGITQRYLAQYLGVSISTFSGWETGVYEPDHAHLCKIADYFGVTVDELLGRTPQLFDDARVPKTEVQDLFDRLNVVDQGRVLGYMYSILEGYGDVSKRRAN